MAANKAFEKDDDVLFYLPITKEFIYGTVVDLWAGCKVSHRDIICHIKSTFGYYLSIGTVCNILDAAGDSAVSINNSYDLSSIRDRASDELYHHNKRILVTVDVTSRFCALLAHANDRDQDTWGINLLDLQAMGYNPNAAILYGAKGLVKGYEIALHDTKLRHDHFHCITDMKDCARFLMNQAASAATEVLKAYQRAMKATNIDKKEKHEHDFAALLSEHTKLDAIHIKFNTLSSWLQYDVLQLAGHPPKDRAALYYFITLEMTALAAIHPHRIDAIVITLNAQRDALLDVANELNEQLSHLAEKHALSLDTIWAICYIARYAINGIKYCEKQFELEALVGSKYDAVEDDILCILETTHRCSSMVENFNSRLRPYLDKRKFISSRKLALIQFYLNHRPFMRSKHERLKNKSPAEVLTKNPHKPCLEMLGFECFRHQAA